MRKRWWRAQWNAAPWLDLEYLFLAADDVELARARLQLNLFYLGYILPSTYTLEQTEPRAGKNYPVFLASRGKL